MEQITIAFIRAMYIALKNTVPEPKSARKQRTAQGMIWPYESSSDVDNAGHVGSSPLPKPGEPEVIIRQFPIQVHSSIEPDVRPPVVEGDVFSRAQRASNGTWSTSTKGVKEVESAEQKYCMDCGQQILRRAEICPKCGCRQLPQQADLKVSVPPIVGPALLMLGVNVLWNGLGNLAVGDQRGWKYGFANLIFFAGAFATFGLSLLAWYAYCGYRGYEYLCARGAGVS